MFLNIMVLFSLVEVKLIFFVVAVFIVVKVIEVFDR